MSDSQTRSFEQALEALENRVRKLEGGDMPLEEALSLFEEGIDLLDILSSGSPTGSWIAAPLFVSKIREMRICRI